MTTVSKQLSSKCHSNCAISRKGTKNSTPTGREKKYFFPGFNDSFYENKLHATTQHPCEILFVAALRRCVMISLRLSVNSLPFREKLSINPTKFGKLKRPVENKGLLFIPDISGFTRFVNETEIEHSRLIIQELLEIMINANRMGLEISEVEGDAILFYKFGKTPELKELYNQVETMFCDFHRHLQAYDSLRYCYCTACTSAINLTLKIVTHYGEFTGYSVKNFYKLIGKDIIVAHQLLKNDIAQHEYWLVTKSLVKDNPPSDLSEWMKWNSSAKETESGEIPYHYTQLTPLKNQIKPEPYPQLELSRKVKMISVSKEFETDIITLFHATGDMNYRSRWQEGVKAVEEVSHFLPRVGMRCRCVMENGETIIYASSYSYHPERIEFSETDEKKKSTTHYLLEKTGTNKTKLTLDYYLKKNILNETLFRVTQKKKMEESINRSLGNLAKFVEEMKITGISV